MGSSCLSPYMARSVCRNDLGFGGNQAVAIYPACIVRATAPVDGHAIR